MTTRILTKTRRSVVGIGLLLLLAGLSPLDSASAQEPAPGHGVIVDDGTVSAPPDPMGALGERGVQRIQAALGDRFAGLWVASPGDPTNVRVGVVRPSPRDAAMVETIASEAVAGNGIGNDRTQRPDVRPVVAIVNAKYSQADLEDFKRFFRDARAKREASSNSLIWPASVLGVDETRNIVFLQVPSNPEAAYELADGIIPPDAFEVEVVEGMGFQMASRNEFPPYIGGLRLRNSAWGSPVCTSGYVFKTGTSTPYFGSTAGHCEGQGFANWYVGDDYVGRTDRNYFRRQNPVIDVLMYPISPNVTSSRIYITSTATRAVVRRAFLSEIGINSLVCVSASSQTVGKCGYIWLEREDIQIGTVIHRDAYCLDAGSTQFQQGDSGSPVYKIASGDDNRAYGAGILAFFYNTLDGPMGECFHTIYDIERESGLTLGVIP